MEFVEEGHVEDDDDIQEQVQEQVDKEIERKEKANKSKRHYWTRMISSSRTAKMAVEKEAMSLVPRMFEETVLEVGKPFKLRWECERFFREHAARYGTPSGEEKEHGRLHWC